MRKREEEVQRALAGHLRDRDKERMQHKHDEAVHNFNALLADLVSTNKIIMAVIRQLLYPNQKGIFCKPLEIT